jgi:hypothetical protein
MKRLLKTGWLLLSLVVVSSWVGCATTENENLAERPWNAPKSWENGLPPSILEGR